MLTSNQQVNELSRKYDAVLRELEKQDANLLQITMQNAKLHIHGVVHSKQALDRIKSRLAQVNPDWHEEVELEVHAPGELPPHTGQTVVNSRDFDHAASDTADKQ